MEKPSPAEPVTGGPQAPGSATALMARVFSPFIRRREGQQAKAVFALALVCFFWGTTWIASKEGVRHMPALQLVAIRQLVGGLCYVLFFLYRGAAWPRGKEWGPVLVLSFLNFGMSNGLSTWGVKFISAGLGSIIGAIFPLWLVLIGFIGGREKSNPKRVAGLLFGFAGICVIFYEYLHDFFQADFRFGIMLSVIATWTWAFGMVYTKKHAVNFNPYFSLGLQMVISGISLYSISHLTGMAIPLSMIPVQSWMAIGYLVLFGSIIAFIAYLYALQRLPTQQVSLYAYINPIVAITLGWLLFEEKLTVFLFAGVLITLYGVWLVNRSVMKVAEDSGK